jgi:hypothetical protein
MSDMPDIPADVLHRYDHRQVLEGEDRYGPEADELVSEFGTLANARLRRRLERLLDAPLDPRDRQRIVRAVDALVVRVDSLAGIAEMGAA